MQLFAANQNKPPEIVTILVTNKSKILRLLNGFKPDKGNIELQFLVIGM
jgi:calcium binding protein 39